MSMITLHAPGSRSSSGVSDTYLNLLTNETGHCPDRGALARVARAAAPNSVLATGVGSMPALTIDCDVVDRPADADTALERFTNLDYAAATHSGRRYRVKHLDDSDIDYAAGTVLLLRAGMAPRQRYFKALVRPTRHHVDGNSAFSSGESTLMLEELVEGRIIWPVRLKWETGQLTVVNPEIEENTVDDSVHEILYTLCNEDAPGNPARSYFILPFPIAKVEFELEGGDDGEEPHNLSQQPRWIERVSIDDDFSKSFMSSTYLVTVNSNGRPQTAENYKFTVHIIDGREVHPIKWDPTVVIDPQ